MDALSYSIQARLAAIVCAHPTRDADQRDAAAHKKRKQEASELQDKDPEILTCAEVEEDEIPDGSEREATRDEELYDMQDSRTVFSLVSGEAADQSSLRFDPSHRIRHRNGVWWCEVCGHFATKRGRKLMEKCAPPTKTGKANLSRIERGLTPHNSVRWDDAES